MRFHFKVVVNIAYITHDKNITVINVLTTCPFEKVDSPGFELARCNRTLFIHPMKHVDLIKLTLLVATPTFEVM